MTLPAVVVVTGCVVPLPGKESTIYDSLPTVQPGQVTGPELESRYGPPELKCNDEALWIYAWAVGKGWMVGIGNGPLAQRLYHTFHIVLVWMDADRRVVRVEVPETFSSWDIVPSQTMCAGDVTCVSTRWFSSTAYSSEGYRLAPDSVVESAGQVLTCSSPLISGHLAILTSRTMFAGGSAAQP